MLLLDKNRQILRFVLYKETVLLSSSGQSAKNTKTKQVITAVLVGHGWLSLTENDLTTTLALQIQNSLFPSHSLLFGV